MLPELERLVALQEVDKEILELSVNLDRLPRQLQEKEQERAALEAEKTASAEELEGLRKQLREMETEVADLEEGIKASRQRLMDISKELELKAMLKEIGFREDQRDQKETRVLELLEKVETQNQSVAEMEQALKQLQEVYDRQAAEVAAQVEELEQKRAVLQEKRDILKKELPAPLLKRYDFIRQRRNGSAISEVQEGVCLGCHMNILPQQFIDLQKGEEIIQCPHCQRILYWLGEKEEEEQEEKAGTRARKVG
ncbi:MAG: zinc ribbon domain-containing protein [Thermodesulfobacteriota bacterium]